MKRRTPVPAALAAGTAIGLLALMVRWLLEAWAIIQIVLLFWALAAA